MARKTTSLARRSRLRHSSRSNARPPVDQARIARAVREIIIAIGENPDREGLRNTSSRIACGLCERLDDHHAGHDGPTGGVSAKERLVVSHILDGPNALAEAVLEHAVDEQKGVAVRQPLEYCVDVEPRRAVAHCMACVEADPRDHCRFELRCFAPDLRWMGTGEASSGRQGAPCFSSM